MSEGVIHWCDPALTRPSSRARLSFPPPQKAMTRLTLGESGHRKVSATKEKVSGHTSPVDQHLIGLFSDRVKDFILRNSSLLIRRSVR